MLWTCIAPAPEGAARGTHGRATEGAARGTMARATEGAAQHHGTSDRRRGSGTMARATEGAARGTMARATGAAFRTSDRERIPTSVTPHYQRRSTCVARGRAQPHRASVFRSGCTDARRSWCASRMASREQLTPHVDRSGACWPSLEARYDFGTYRVVHRQPSSVLSMSASSAFIGSHVLYQP
jgi:hypothetical protein